GLPGRLRNRAPRLRHQPGRRSDRARGLRRVRPGPVRRRLGRPHEPDPVAFPSGERPRVPHADLRRAPRQLRRGRPRARRWRGGSPARRDDLRHAEREGGDRGGARGRPRRAAHDLGHDHRPKRADALRPDRGGVLGLDRARTAVQRRRELRAGGRRVAPVYTTCHPNAGLPNAFGGYDERPEITSKYLREFAESGLANVLGGCCGTTDEHIRQIAAAVEGLPPRRPPTPEPVTTFAGLEPFAIRPDTGFVMVGERTNITGSKRFRRLIESGDYQGAVEVALEQVRGGANLIDVNMDADLLDSERAMTTFLNLIAT